MALRLVDADYAETKLKFENLVGVEADHYGVCLLEGAQPILDEIAGLLQSVINIPASITSPEAVVDSGESSGHNLWTSTASYVVTDTGAGIAEGRGERTELTEESSFSVVDHVAENTKTSRIPEVPRHAIDFLIPSPDFTGRDDVIDRLDKALISKDSDEASQSARQLKRFALCGMGGLGKTQVAINFAMHRKQHFDAVFWLQADDATKLEAGLSEIALQLAIVDETEAEDQVICRNIAVEWLSDPKKRDGISGTKAANWLIIFDNADNPEELTNDWRQFTNGSILVTSRDPVAMSNLYYSEGMILEVLPEKTGAQLLRDMTKSGTDQSELEGSTELTKRLDGLPLAISQAAGLMIRRELDFKGFISLFEADNSIFALAMDHPARYKNRYAHTLLTTWALNDLKTDSPSAFAMLNVISLLDASISHSIFQVKSLPEEHLNFPSTNLTYNTARTELSATSLIRVKEKQLIVIHRLVQDVARSSMTDSEYLRHFRLALHILIDALPEREQFSHDSSTWQQTELILPHALKLRSSFLNKAALALDENAACGLAKLIQIVGWHMIERGYYDRAKPLLLHVGTLAQKYPQALKSVAADVSKSLFDLEADTRGSPEACLQHAQDHFLQRQQLDDGSQFARDNIAMGHGDLGFAYMYCGRYNESIEHCKKSQEIDFMQPDIIAGQGWPHFAFIHEAWSLVGLGLYSEAADGLNRTLSFRIGRYGAAEEPAYKLGLILLALGKIKVKQQKFDEAFQLHRRALANFEGTVGEKHYRTCHSYVRLAEHFSRLKDWDQARIHIKNALDGLESHPFYRKDLALTSYIGSEICLACGDAVNAERYQAKARALYLQLVPGTDRAARLDIHDYEVLLDISSR